MKQKLELILELPDQRSSQLQLNFKMNTVEPPINGHSKIQTPLISGQFHFPRPFFSQILIKKVSKRRTLN